MQKCFIFASAKMESKVITVEGIGEITLRKNDKARRLSIRVIPFKGIVVTIPRRGNYAEAGRFVEARRRWILSSMEKVKSYQDEQLVFDENTVFATHSHVLKIIYEVRQNIGVVVTKTTLLIRMPVGIDIRHKRMQDVIRNAIEHTMKIEAKEYLPGRLKELAEQHGFRYKKVTIRSTTSRWGSCTADNSINLSSHLMRLPSELIDYVLLHELAHTVQKNHGPGFWSLLEKVAGSAREKSKKIRKYSPDKY